MTTHNSSVMTAFLVKDLSSPFFLTYIFGLAFNPQLDYFLEFFNWLCFLFHMVILLQSNFFRLFAFLHMFFSRFSFLLFLFFTLPYFLIFFSWLPFLLSFFIWIFPPHLVLFVPHSHKVIFNIFSGIFYFLFHLQHKITSPATFIHQTHALSLYIPVGSSKHICFLGPLLV